MEDTALSIAPARRVVWVTGCLLLVTACAFPRFASRDADRFPAELRAVLTYAVGENHPEVANGKEYPLRLRGVEVLDVDRNGSTEVFVWSEPHLNYSPTITIYSIDEDGEVSRISEGLAPGPLVPASGDRVDTHGLGLAVDFVATAKEGEPGPREFARIALEQAMHVVYYRDFFHTDGRGGQHSYIDMSLASPARWDQQCASFEFARLDDLAVGSLLEDPDGGYVVAATSGRLYLYRIDGITPGGFLDKRVWVVDQEPGYLKLTTSDAGIVEYESSDGARHPVSRAPVIR